MLLKGIALSLLLVVVMVVFFSSHFPVTSMMMLEDLVMMCTCTDIDAGKIFERACTGRTISKDACGCGDGYEPTKMAAGEGMFKP